MLHTAMVATAALLAAASTSHADVSVLLTRDGVESLWGTYATAQPIDDLPPLDDSYTRVRVLGDGQDAIGRLSLTGSRSPGSVLLMEVQGGGTWAGVETTQGVVELVTLTAMVGSITGPVDVGVVSQIDAGSVAAPLTAHAIGTPQGPTLGVITVLERIDGALTAVRGGIGSITAGRGAPGDGLFAGVSSAGVIGEVIINGQIAVAAPAGIRARDGIGTIRCLDVEAGYGPIDAHIDANTGGHGGADDQRLGCLYTLECGTLSGSVRARLLDDALGGAQRRSIHAGLVHAPIIISEYTFGRIEVFAMLEGSRIDVGRDLLASVTAQAGITEINIAGNIDLVFSCVPTWVICHDGPMGALRVGGNIETTIWCEDQARIWARGGIGTLEVAGNLTGSICDPEGVHTASLGRVSVGGNLNANIAATTLESLDVVGSFDGGLRIDGLGPTDTIRIGGANLATIVIETPGGLEGQITTNALAQGGAASTGPLFIASPSGGWDALAPVDYPQGADGLGGGALGEAPFRLHVEDCGPAACRRCPPPVTGGDAVVSGGIALRFYGPVRVGQGAQVLHVFAADSTGQPIAGAPDMGGSLDVLLEDPRTLRIKPMDEALLRSGTWVIRPVQGGLLCEGLMTGADVPVANFSFAFTAEGCQSADFNRDGDIGTDADIQAFFACLAGDCCAACGTADFDGDGDLGVDADLEAFFRVLAGGPC